MRFGGFWVLSREEAYGLLPLDPLAHEVESVSESSNGLATPGIRQSSVMRTAGIRVMGMTSSNDYTEGRRDPRDSKSSSIRKSNEILARFLFETIKSSKCKRIGFRKRNISFMGILFYDVM